MSLCWRSLPVATGSNKTGAFFTGTAKVVWAGTKCNTSFLVRILKDCFSQVFKVQIISFHFGKPVGERARRQQGEEEGGENN
jgi:hypothetical protein